MNCWNCGEAAEPAQGYCDVCGARLDRGQETAVLPPRAGDAVPAMAPEPAGAGSAAEPPGWAGPQPAWPPGPPSGPAPAPAPPAPFTTLPGSPVRLGDGEHILRIYRAVKLRTRSRGEGTLYVTDMRVVFFARAAGRGTRRASTLMQQTKLEDIAGVAAFVARRVNLFLLVLTALSVIAALVGVASGNGLAIAFWGFVAVACVASVAMGAAEWGQAGVTIYSKSTQTSPISFGRFGNHRSWLEVLGLFLLSPLLLLFRAKTVWDVLLGRPGEDSERLISEIGALILDLQTRGTHAAPHWGVSLDNGQSPQRERG